MQHPSDASHATHRGRRAPLPGSGRSAALIAFALLGACATTPRVPFTAAEHARAVPVGFPGVRHASGDPAILATMRDAADRQRETAPGRPLTILALSGGGANGAFGAGLLRGWSEAGKRPQFTLVTGVSTGALIAPFAFLGSAWDDRLTAAYTDGHASRLLGFPGLRPLLKNSVFSGKPLRALIESFVDQRMLAAVAAEHRKGRRLLVATADLDSQQLVVWDMGAIASRGGPAARALFVDVMVASASIPGVFPPVMIRADVGSRVIGEMHVDGTTINAFFAVPDAALLLKEGPPADGTIYVLINGKADEEFAVAKDSLLSIIARSYDTATKASQRTALTALAAFGENNRIATKMAAIPADTEASSLDFSRAAMMRLFALGRARGLSGKIWDDLPDKLRRPGTE